MKNYEESKADVLECIQMLLELESIKIGTDIQAVSTVTNDETGQVHLFVALEDTMTIEVSVG